MSKKRRQQRHLRRPPKGRGGRKTTDQVVHLLEQGTLRDLRQAKETTRKLIDYHWTLYSELALQRSHLEKDLTQALNEASVANFPNVMSPLTRKYLATWYFSLELRASFTRQSSLVKNA